MLGPHFFLLPLILILPFLLSPDLFRDGLLGINLLRNICFGLIQEMGTHMKKFGLILAMSSFVALAVGLAGCGAAPSKPTTGGTPQAGTVLPDGTVIGPDGQPAPVANVPMAESLASFEANLYKPLLQPFCASCHGTTFVENDVSKAHAAFLTRAGFDKFAGIDQTLPVLKMKQSHNCWDGSTKVCVGLMQEKMDLWLKDLEFAGFKPTPVKYPNATDAVALKDNAAIALTIPGEYAFAGVDKATLAAPFTMGTDDIDGAIKSYVTSPAGTVRAAAANNAQSLTFNLDAKVAGTYFVWARVKTEAEASNEFFVRANNGNGLAFIAPVTGKDTWKWAQMMVVANNANTVNPFTFNVAAPGAIPMAVLFREATAKINQLVITTKPDFNGDQFTNSFKDISVPLKVPGADGAKIVATVWENTTEEGKRSLGVKELKIISPVPLHVKGIYPLINGIFSANHGTFTLVDTTAGGPDATKSVINTGGATSSTWIADITLDKLSFSFDVIEVAK